MAENTKISWATHTFSPWIGCSKVASGCANCYAEAMAGRLGVTWGANGTRRRTAQSTWKQVERWNRQAAHAAEKQLQFVRDKCRNGIAVGRPKLFPSLCDPFEDFDRPVFDLQSPVNHVGYMDDVRRDFFALIDRTPNLDWLLLTKRPQNIRRMWPDPEGFVIGGSTSLRRENIWLLYSASDQQSLEAGYGHLRLCRDLVPVLGLSLEPLVGPIDFAALKLHMLHDIDWVIVGGESGPRARPCNVDWIQSIVRQCREAGVPCFVKQLGDAPEVRCDDRHWSRNPSGSCDDNSCRKIVLSARKGGDPSEWPKDLRVREFPHGR